MTIMDIATDENLTVEVAQQLSKFNLSKPVRKTLGVCLGFAAGAFVYILVTRPDWATKGDQ